LGNAPDQAAVGDGISGLPVGWRQSEWLVALFVSWWYVFAMGLKEGNCVFKAQGGKPVHLAPPGASAKGGCRGLIEKGEWGISAV
jgi:hypothetical protein